MVLLRAIENLMDSGVIQSVPYSECGRGRAELRVPSTGEQCQSAILLQSVLLQTFYRHLYGQCLMIVVLYIILTFGIIMGGYGVSM